MRLRYIKRFKTRFFLIHVFWFFFLSIFFTFSKLSVVFPSSYIILSDSDCLWNMIIVGTLSALVDSRRDTSYEAETNQIFDIQ